MYNTKAFSFKIAPPPPKKKTKKKKLWMPAVATFILQSKECSILL